MSPQVDALDAETIRVALSGERIGNHVLVLEETTSTNDVVAKMAPDSAEGFVVIAEQQTAGRGQYGRRWESTAARGLWFSVLLRPGLSVSESARLTDFLARAIAETINTELGVVASIKPPNDVYIAGRKVAGVLVEMRVEASGNYCAIAGAGINVNHAAEDFPIELRGSAVSLAMAAGRTLDRSDFLVALLRMLNNRYRTLRQELGR